MTKKQQIQQLEAKVKELQKEHFDTLAELNNAKESWRKEQESYDASGQNRFTMFHATPS